MTRILGARVLAAGNVAARRPVVRLKLAEAVPFDAGTVRAIVDAVPQGGRRRAEKLAFPAWQDLAAATVSSPGVPSPGAPVPAARVIEALALLFQRWLNWPVTFAAGAGPDPVFETRQPEAGLAAAEAAVAFLGSVDAAEAGGLPRILADALEAHAAASTATTPTSDTMAIAVAAERRGIPFATVPGDNTVRLGQGRFAHMIYGAETSRTSSIGRMMAKDKRIAHGMLVAAGLPVPAQRAAANEADAVAAARALGFPVAIKPATGNMGRGATAGVGDAAEVAAAFAKARAVGPVIVEAMIPGEEYRLLVVDGHFFAASRHEAAHVVGDGVRSVLELVAIENANPDRQEGMHVEMVQIRLDGAARGRLAEQALTLESVPAAGRVVWLRRASNVSQGGTVVDVTERVHPDNRAAAERAALAMGLDVCGVDLITTDIARSPAETGGAICEVNSRPALSLHLGVVGGPARDAATAVAASLYPDGARGRLPVVAVLRAAGDPAIEAALVAAGAAAGRRIGLAPPGRFGAGRAAVEALTWDGTLDGAVVALTPEQLVRHGVGLDRVDLAILPAIPAGDAEAALDRIAEGRTVRAGDPAAMARALAVFGLSGPAPAVAAAPPPDRDGFTVLFAGDIGFGESYLGRDALAPVRRRLAVDGHGGSLARLAALLGSADMVVGNLEVPLAATPDMALTGAKNWLHWCEPAETVAALVEAGFGAVGLANNHMLDCGVPGLAATIARLAAAGIATFGAGVDRDAAAAPFVRTIRVGGGERTLVVFAAFEHRDRYEERYGWYAGHDRPGTATIDPDAIGRRIAMLRATLPAPFFVAFPHWGVDYQPVKPYQRVLAERLVAAGIDLVVGHGAHVLQGVERIGRVPVVYGLGNFAFNAPGRFAANAAPPYGLAASLRFGPDGRAALRLHPLLVDNARSEYRTRPVVAAEFEAARALVGADEREAVSGIDAAGRYVEIPVG